MATRPAASPVRIAGDGRLTDGALVTWVVSEGRRGRRWRETVRAPDGVGLRSSLLYETDPAGRFSHLELATLAGLATLHPEGDGTLHGNVVTRVGVRHVVGHPYPTGSAVIVAGSPIAVAAAMSGVEARTDDAGLGRLRTALPLRVALVAVVLDAAFDLSTRELVVTIEPDGGRTIDLELGYGADADGLPVLLHGHRWPLELDAASWTDRGQTPPDGVVDHETRG